MGSCTTIFFVWCRSLFAGIYGVSVWFFCGQRVVLSVVKTDSELRDF
jgi:hypothetical protein